MVESETCTAQLLREICHESRVTGGRDFELRSANTTDDVRVDVSARSFWARGQRAFVDVRIFNPMAPRNWGHELRTAHVRHEKRKGTAGRGSMRFEHEQRSFTPLIFPTTEGMAPTTTTFYAILAQQLAEKTTTADEQCHHVVKMSPLIFPGEVRAPVSSRDEVKATTLP